VDNDEVDPWFRPSRLINAAEPDQPPRRASRASVTRSTARPKGETYMSFHDPGGRKLVESFVRAGVVTV